MANKPQQARKRTLQAQKLVSWVGRLGHPIVLSTLATSAVVLGVRALGALQGLELGVYDQMIRSRPALPPDDRILVVGIDETDIQARREWPIQDATVAELLAVIEAANPRAIGLDLFRDVPLGEGQAALLAQIQTSDRIIPVCKISSSTNPGVPPPEGTPPAQVGFSDLVVDPGGILRRNLLAAAPPADSTAVREHLCSTPEAQLLSLSFQLALRYLAAEGIAIEQTPNQEIKLQDTVLHRLQASTGGYQNAEASGYQILFDYRAAENAIPQVSLTAVLSGQVPADQIRDRIILIGATTPEAKDDFYTPYSGGLRDNQKMPGVIVHAQSVSQLLSAVLDDRPLLWSWPTWTERLWVVVWAVGGSVFAWYVRRPLRFTLGAAVLVGGLYGSCFMLLLNGGWVPLVPAALASALAAGGVVLLDRFKKSDYGQTVYKQMKNLLRLDIEIDREKVGQQIAEITETDYFANLQQQARQLRQQRPDRQAMPKPTPPASPPPEPTADPQESMQTLVDDLKQKARRLHPPDEDASK